MTTPYRPPSCDLLEPKLKECPLSMLVYIYNVGYLSGHHGTVEGCFIDIHQSDMATYHEDEVEELLDDLNPKWNSIPRRSEVTELLRLVDAVTDWEGTLINTDEFYEDGNQMIAELNQLQKHADRMRKEWKL